MPVQPTGTNIAVRRHVGGERSEGGIFIPEAARAKSSAGVVVAVGPGHIESDGSVIPVDVLVGDKVLFQHYAGTEFEVDGETLLILKESDLVAVVPHED